MNLRKNQARMNTERAFAFAFYRGFFIVSTWCTYTGLVFKHLMFRVHQINDRLK